MERFLQAGDAAGERAFWVRICASMWDVSVFRKLEKGSVTGCAYEKGSVLDIVNSSPSPFAGAGDGSDNRVCPLPDVR
jgi:hypothetical protein